ncbi:hypothetical protein CDAR_189881 [Caerostris darwini]|uniref:Uncharacterized protein n=1 Tax=Caerostris darwini TaxID=1538125 RepID=A0AAV4W055_9ARAC|nr:hypothetical protein CDAR_189881 [Caerostris darwini]
MTHLVLFEKDYYLNIPSSKERFSLLQHVHEHQPKSEKNPSDKRQPFAKVLRHVGANVSERTRPNYLLPKFGIDICRLQTWSLTGESASFHYNYDP